MIAHPLPPPLSVEEYLELEENSTIKHEYLDGYVYAMVGGSVDYGAIVVNVLAALRPQLRGGPYRVYNSDVGVRLGPRRFVYPDLSVSCDPRDYANGHAPFISRPRLVIEVLSPKTAVYD
ncbi:MAG: Uma2 family endonuclease, partial [Chloroflexota bacterium]